MKSLIVNTLGDKNHFFNVPASVSAAETFATNFLDGQSICYEEVSKGGTDAVSVGAKSVTLLLRNSTSEAKFWMTLLVPASTTEASIKTALVGITLYGQVIDEIFVTGIKPITIV